MRTRDLLVDTAMQMFAEQGYGSTSIAVLLRRAGVNAGSLYHFFPTKQALLMAVLERYRDGIEPMLLVPSWAGVADPIERIFALLQRYRELLVESDCSYGCPIGSLALELHEPDPEVRQLLAANFSLWSDHIRRCLDEGADRLPPDIDRQRLARFVLTTMEGGVMQARTYRSIEPFDESIACLRDYFARLGESS